MPSPDQLLIPRTSSLPPAEFPPLMDWACDGIGGLWDAPLLPASPIPSAHHAGRPWMPSGSPLLVDRRPRPSSSPQAAPGPSSRPLIWEPSGPCLDPENLGISPHSKSCRIVISPGEKSQLRLCCAKNMFLRVSGTLRNPPGPIIKTTKPRTQKPGICRIDFNVNLRSLQ